MRKILIFGNSGAGKSTLARKLSTRYGLAHLDLDTLAWEAATPPVRRPLQASGAQLDEFVAAHAGWVIEGCYTDLLELVANAADEIYWLNLPVETCMENARSRPWEPHKYASKREQDANLTMLLEWISQYPDRHDTFSAAAHTRLYNEFSGKKHMLTRNTPWPG